MLFRTQAMQIDQAAHVTEKTEKNFSHKVGIASTQARMEVTLVDLPNVLG